MSKERSVFSNDLHKSTLAARAYFILRSSAKVFCIKNVLKNFAYSTGKHLRWNLLLLKLHCRFCRFCNFIKKRLQHRCFPMEFVNLLRTSILYNISNGCFWFVQAFNLDMLRDKRRRFNRIFQKDEITIPPSKKNGLLKGWKYPLRIVLQFFKNCQKYTQQTCVGLEDVLKTSWRHVLKTSSARLQRNNFSSSKTSWKRFERHLAKRFEDILKTCLKDVLETCLEDVLKKCLQDVLETNKSKCVYLWSNKSTFNKSISDKSKANPKCID